MDEKTEATEKDCGRGLNRGRRFCIEVAGDYACFTRPDQRSERVSYDFITPSAARGIFSAIFWKPAIDWHVTRIDVMNPIRFMNLAMNEVDCRMDPRAGAFDIDEHRTQRLTFTLVDVRYRIYAEFDFIPPERRGGGVKWEKRPDDTPAKYAAMFSRRASKGQFHHVPCLGMRQFACRTVRLVDDDEVSSVRPIPVTRDFGRMILLPDYEGGNSAHDEYFEAKMVDGSVAVPRAGSREDVS